ncbi:hypothetical protein [Phyllobacterium zundukense]|uniref:Uncharacterized protein n=1 Tax=Phyllobacterium zundukense TaxID=1867719 RepID=A0ACD4CY71_9HYPH|nr:hypothetical protein [Phyllobacterium zundukense]UXN58509.1 hypothetical protein N8E88_10820 [Phyllobacterium zundukense]
MPNSKPPISWTATAPTQWALQTELTTEKARPAEAIEQVRKALRLNPHWPGWYYWMLGQAQYAIGDYNSAIQTLRRKPVGPELEIEFGTQIQFWRMIMKL